MQERYNYDNKESALRAISEHNFNDSKYLAVYESEAIAISNYETYADLLAITSWSKIPTLAQIIFTSLEELNSGKTSVAGTDNFHNDISKRVDNWNQEIFHNLNRIGTSHTVRKFLSSTKSLISFVQGHETLQKMCKTLILCDNAGAIPQDTSNPILIQYPGSFNPFPHPGHIELSLLAKENNINDNIMVVVTTFSKNKHRVNQPSLPFSIKINMLNRGFAFENDVMVIGIPGDTDCQSQQMQLLATLSSDQSVHYILGNDAFITKIRQAKSKDGGVLGLFNKNTTFYVSRRNNYNDNLLDESYLYTRGTGCKVIFLPKQQLSISGTNIRQKLESNNSDNNFYPNKYVKDYVDKDFYLSSL